MTKLELFKTLKEKGYPQGGTGNYIIDPATGDKFYIPKPEEIYNLFINSPKDWERFVEEMAKLWIETQSK